jgi:hypothetical protein
MSPARFVSGLALAALLVAGAARAEKLRTHFDSDSAGRPPGFFDFVVWNAPGEADWLVLGDVNPPSTPNKLIQTIDKRPVGSLAVALRRTYTFQDGEISVGLRRGNAQAGIVFRAAGEKDFLLLLVNVATGEARLSSYRDGKATELARGQAEIDRDWGTLSVAAAGASLTARWNGKSLLTATDPYPVAGRVGLATTGPGQASFDELVFDTSPAAK